MSHEPATVTEKLCNRKDDHKSSHDVSRCRYRCRTFSLAMNSRKGKKELRKHKLLFFRVKREQKVQCKKCRNEGKTTKGIEYNKSFSLLAESRAKEKATKSGKIIK